MCELIAAPKETAAFLKDRVKPAAPLEPKRVDALLRQLGDGHFTVRDNAAKELFQIGECIIPAIETRPSPPTRHWKPSSAWKTCAAS